MPGLVPLGVMSRERDTYEAAWAIEKYAERSPGERLMPLLAELLMPVGSVLDAGCGSGKTGVGLAGLGHAVTLCDLTPDGLTDEACALPFVARSLTDDLFPVAYLAGVPEGKFDWVVCCDVMEHLPTAFTMLAVRRMLDVARRGLFLSICFGPDRLGLMVGKPLHQTVMPYLWWLDGLREMGRVLDARDLCEFGVFLVQSEKR